MNDSPIPSTPAPQDARPSVSTTRRFATVCVVALLVVGGAIVAANRDGIPETGAAPAAPSPSTTATEAPVTTVAPTGTQPQRVPTKPAQATPTLSASDRESLFRAILGSRLHFITVAQAKETALATCDTLDSGVPWAIAKTAAATVGDNLDLEQWQVDELALAQEIGVRAFCPDQAWQLGAEVG